MLLHLKIKTSGFKIKVFPITILCFCPPDNLTIFWNNKECDKFTKSNVL